MRNIINDIEYSSRGGASVYSCKGSNKLSLNFNQDDKFAEGICLNSGRDSNNGLVRSGSVGKDIGRLDSPMVNRGNRIGNRSKGADRREIGKVKRSLSFFG